MRALFFIALTCIACGPATGARLTLNFPAELIGNGFLHAAVFESGRCSELSSPVSLESAVVRESDPPGFDAENRHPMELSGIPAGSDRMIVAIIERDGAQICRACGDGLLIEDGGTTKVTLTLRGCPAP
ncbi:MAG: hypothetical protein OSB21_02030 [Myxococcota bacterium]|nr:hypothetical protein [Myxococcota bacterium]